MGLQSDSKIPGMASHKAADAGQWAGSAEGLHSLELFVTLLEETVELPVELPLDTTLLLVERPE